MVCVLALLAQATGSMPPKLPFTAERAEQFGALSAEKAALALRDGHTVTQHELSCSYRGSRAAAGSVDAIAELFGRQILILRTLIPYGITVLVV